MVFKYYGSLDCGEEYTHPTEVGTSSGNMACVGSSAGLKTGNLYHSQQIGPLSISYNSIDPYAVPLGKGWTHNYNLRIFASSTTGALILKREDGNSTFFRLSGGTYYPDAQSGDTSRIIKNTDNTYTQTLKDGTLYRYNSLTATAAGRLSSLTDPNNKTTTLSYTGADLTGITDPNGHTVILTVSSGRITSLTDSGGRIYTLTYTGDALTSIALPSEPPAVINWQFTYWPSGAMKTKTDPEGNLTQYFYDDTTGMLTGAIDPEGKTKSIAYDKANNKATITERDGGVWVYTYDSALNQPLEITGPDGKKTVFTYGPWGNVLTKTEPGNRTTTYTYNDPNNPTSPTSITDPAGKTTLYTYTALGKAETVTDPTQRTTHYGYDSRGNLTSVKMSSPSDPLTDISAFTYDPVNGNLTGITADGKTTILHYDDPNNRSAVTSIVDPFGATTGYTYYPLTGALKDKTDSLGNFTEYSYTPLDQLKTVTVHLSETAQAITRYTYDGNGNIESIINPNNHTTTYTYNYRDQLTRTTDPLGNITDFAYGSAGCASCGSGGDRLVSTTDANGKTTLLGYNTLGQLTGQTNPLLKTVTFSYDPDTRRLSGLTDPANATTDYSYYPHDLVSAVIDPLNKTTSLGYDDAGRLNSKTDRLLHLITYTHTLKGQIKTAAYPDAFVLRFGYDALGRIQSIEDRLGAASHAYNDPLREATVTDSQGFVVKYRYDSEGNLIELTYPGNKVVTYTYDALNRLETVTTWLGQTATYTYEGTQLKSLESFNGITTTYGYDNADRLISLENKKSDTSVIASYSFILDPVGNKLQSTQQEPFLTMPVLESVLYTYNTQKNRLTFAGPFGFTYDDEGQLQSGYGKTYAFDYDHRLSGAGTDQYYYDGLGNRLKAVRNGVATKYLYDKSGNLLAEVDGANNITKYYIHGLGLLAMVTPTDQTYSYHYNAIGSTIAVTDQGQNIVNKYSYEPFGTVESQTELLPQPFKYVGQYGVMAETNGLYLMGARYYDPKVGRFISEDPIGFEGGTVNLSEYVGGNPVNAIDPEGLSVSRCCRDVQVNPIIDKAALILGVKHCFIKTDSKEAGMGPADGGPLPTVPVGIETKIIDHSGQSARSKCEEVSEPEVDEACVNRELEIGKKTGQWWPWNQCNSLVEDVIKKCTKKKK